MIIRFAAILNVTFTSDSHFPPNREILGLLKKLVQIKYEVTKLSSSIYNMKQCRSFQKKASA